MLTAPLHRSPPPYRADPTVAADDGTTLLMALARRGQHNLMSELLRGPAAATINQRDAAGMTALHHAAAAGSFNACRVLRVHGADPSLRTSVEGKPTAFQVAEAGGHDRLLPLLRVKEAAAR